MLIFFSAFPNQTPLSICLIFFLFFVLWFSGLTHQRNVASELNEMSVYSSSLQASTEEDTYSPVNDKEKEDPQNGTYIGLADKNDPQI